VPTCRPDDRLRDVCKQLDDSGWDTGFVVDDRGVVLGRLGRRAIRGKANASARLEAMVERMHRQKLTNLPVTTSDGRLVGLLTLRDAEEALRSHGG
jgi:CBS domain-containing protein